jgi:hypothetical protein
MICDDPVSKIAMTRAAPLIDVMLLPTSLAWQAENRAQLCAGGSAANCRTAKRV